MIENQEIKSLLENQIEQSEVIVEGDGYHYQVVVISDIFSNLSRVKRMQEVYKVLNDHIQSGALHALSIKPYTAKEWQERKNG